MTKMRQEKAARIPETYEARLLRWKWRAYDFAAMWCAKRGLKGAVGDPLPELLDPNCYAEINADPEAFAARVKDFAYGNAMELHRRVGDEESGAC